MTSVAFLDSNPPSACPLEIVRLLCVYSFFTSPEPRAYFSRGDAPLLRGTGSQPVRQIRVLTCSPVLTFWCDLPVNHLSRLRRPSLSHGLASLALDFFCQF